MKDSIIFIASPRLFHISVRSIGNSIRIINLYNLAKTLKIPLYSKSYFSTGRILSIELLDRLITFLKIRTRNNLSVIIPDPRGNLINHDNLFQIYEKFNFKRNILIISPKLSGYDDRILKLHKIELFSIGDFILSSGNSVTDIIIDFIDRNHFMNLTSKTRGINKDSLIHSRIAGSRNFGWPSVYKGIKVPEYYLSGNDKLFETNRMLELAEWTLDNNFKDFIKLLLNILYNNDPD